MKTLFTAVFSYCLLATALGQTSADVTIPITVNNFAGASVTLSWPAPPPGTTQLVVARKQLFETTWTPLAQLPVNTTSYTDVGLGVGQSREYLVLQNSSGTPPQRVGLAFVGQDIPAFTGSRGKIVLVIDEALSAPLATELARLEADLRGDGWQVVRHDINAVSSSVPSVKALIRADWEADPNTLCALLFGNIPVPYSGEIAPDGHGDHVGAWPTDYYYGDMDEELWTDTLVDNSTASRTANRNVPGDGKFDQSQTPSLPEVVVSRVDFSNLNGWSVSQTELYRRYLNKNHAFRTGAYKPQNQTLVDDNFGYFSGEAFAQNGWRNGYAITGSSSVVAADFFNDTDNQSFLIGYGTGAGSYTSAAGVGTSDNFKTDSVNIVFSMIFGSYHGDWDYELNPLMPSALASKGSILTCAWAGRPNWHMHHMALGQPIWLSTYWTWLNSFLNFPVYPTNFGADLVHVGLLGDPTLRAHSVIPPANLTAAPNCSGVDLAWAASPDAALGYYVYRAASPDSVFQLLTPSPVSGLVFTDNAPLSGANYYQVKSLKKEVVPTGSYFNQSIAAAAQAVFSGVPQLSAAPSAASCNGGSDGQINLVVTGGSPAYTYLWSNSATTEDLEDLTAATYTVTVTDQAGCSATATVSVGQPSALNVTAGSTPASCFGGSNGAASLTITGGASPYNVVWSNNAQGPVVSNLPAGTYGATVTDASGCTKTTQVVIGQPTALNVQSNIASVGCAGGNNGAINITVAGGTSGYSYNWADLPGANNSEDRAGLAAGNYSLTVTDQNNCTAVQTYTVTAPAELTLLTSVTNAVCDPPSPGGVVLSVGGGTPGYTFLWSNAATTQNLLPAAPGAYTVTVTDANNCTQTTSATVTQNSSLNGTLTPTSVLCFGQATGSVALSVSGGTQPFAYLWSNAATTANLSSVPAGNYSVTVTDVNNCVLLASATVTQPAQIVTSTITGNVLCFGEASGNINLSVSGGTGGYSYLWDNGATTEDLSGLPAGFYFGSVTDANGCVKSFGAPVNEPDELSLAFAATNPVCHGDENGIIQATASGGTPFYTFLWSNGATTPEIVNLAAGVHIFTVTDSNGCSASQAVTLTEPAPVQGNYSVGGPLCFGETVTLNIDNISGGSGGPYAYSIDGGPQLPPSFPSEIGAGAHVLAFFDALACASFATVTISEPDPIVLQTTATPTSCANTADGTLSAEVSGGVPPLDFEWSNGETSQNITDLEAGEYELTLTDANGCTATATGSVSSPLPYDAPIAGADTVCVGFPDQFTLPADLSNYVWFAGSSGIISEGQGTAAVSIVWTEPGVQQILCSYDDPNGCEGSSAFSVIAQICLGAGDLPFADVTLTPNPFSEVLQLQFKGTFYPDAQLRLFDTQGRLLLQEQAGGTEYRLATGSLPEGAYFLTLSDREQTRVWKVVKVE